MMTIVTHTFGLGPRTLQLETGRIARQASGAVLVSDGLAKILCTVVVAAQPTLGDFVPLSVHYLEKAYAGGKIPGGFVKREAKPADHEVLISRLIDRAVRPTIPGYFHHEVQLICTVLSADEGADLPAMAILGGSAALLRAGVPCTGPVAAIRLGCHPAAADESVPSAATATEFFLGKEALSHGALDLMIAGTPDGVVMVECSAQQLPEETLVAALDHGQRQLTPVLEGLKAFLEMAGPSDLTYEDTNTLRKALFERMQELCQAQMQELCTQGHKQTRNRALSALRQHACTVLGAEGMDPGLANAAFSKVWRHCVRRHILDTGKRVDGRAFDQVRSIECQARILPRSSGSALFTRGDTQALVSVVQGGKEDGQLVDSLDGMQRDGFLVHYNFPGFSVNEIGRMAGPGRREIGHGKLAWRALRGVMPVGYTATLRIVSEITESCGSSSMATVCGACLALFDAGVPLDQPVAGIAMGLVQEGDQMALLSDITGLEDEIGDMDFKVAGTPKGITALQMDLKGQPLTHAFMHKALEQAKVGRQHILAVMTSQVPCQLAWAPNPHGPTVSVLTIDPDRVRDLIGPGGKTIKELCESCGVRIEIGDGGRVSIFGTTGEAAQKAAGRIAQMMGNPEEGVVYPGTVVSVLDFGAFVDIGFAQQGLVHISEIADQRIDNIHDVLTKGDRISVRVVGFDRGRAKLSIKQA